MLLVLLVFGTQLCTCVYTTPLLNEIKLWLHDTTHTQPSTILWVCCCMLSLIYSCFHPFNSAACCILGSDRPEYSHHLLHWTYLPLHLVGPLFQASPCLTVLILLGGDSLCMVRSGWWNWGYNSSMSSSLANNALSNSASCVQFWVHNFLYLSF